MTQPTFSVVMSVLNGEEFLAEAIDSVLSQTFADFEFIIVDNASTDRTAEIIAGYDDARIVSIRNAATVNLSQSLNIGLGRARGRHVARLDADDIAKPERLARQAAFLDEHPEVALLGAAWTTFGADGGRAETPQPAPPVDHEAILFALAERNVLTHSSIAFRRDVVADLGNYDDTFTYCMDYDLYFRIAAQHRLAVIAEPLVAVRIHGNQITRAPSWQVPRSREILRVAKGAANHPFLDPAARVRARHHMVRLCLRLAQLSFRDIKLAAAAGWFAKAFLTGPAAAMRLVCGFFRRAGETETPPRHA